MSLYVPAMQNASYANLIQQSGRDTARSFLDGVRMHNENKHKAKMMENEKQRIDIQRQTMENNAKFRDRALDITEGQFAQQSKMFNQAQQDRADRVKTARSLVKYQMDDSKRKGEVNEQLNPLTETLLGSEIDPNKKRLYVGYDDVGGTDGWEAVQWASPKEIAKAKANKAGSKEAVLDPSLIDTIKDPSMLHLLPKYAGQNEGMGNMLYNSVMNSLWE